MASFNKVIIVGNLTADPEMRYTPKGAAVCELRIAVNEYAGKGKQDKAVFLDVTVWENQAENCSAHLKKGSQILVDGRLDMDEWEDKETGKKRSKLKVVAFSVKFLGGKPGGSTQRSAPKGEAFPGDDIPSSPQGELDSGDEIPF